ncbi:MAG: hypothetical protein SFX74_03655 [Fimbriimonadaceae bacterium]|nr:hypothetical protein [Fimbriimonadaceae bacterium]
MAKRLHPVHVLLAITALVGFLFVAFLVDFSRREIEARNERRRALQSAQDAGLPTRFDAIKVKVRPQDDASSLLRQINISADRAKRSPTGRAVERASKTTPLSDDIAAATAFTRSHPSLVTLVKNVLDKRQVPVSTRPELGYEEPIPNPLAAKLAARILILEIMRLVDRGEITPALNLTIRQARFAHVLAEEPHGVSRVSSQWILIQLDRVVAWIMASQVLSDSQHLQVEQYLALRREGLPARDAIRGEFCLLLAFEQSLIRGERPVDDAEDRDKREHLLDKIRSTSRREAAFANAFRCFARLVREVPTDVDRIQEARQKCDAIIASHSDPKNPSHVLVIELPPMYADDLTADASMEARRRFLVTYFGLVRRHGPRGPFPAQLEGLPKDPFSGKPLIYRRTNSGFVLYSVGPDGTDHRLKKSNGKQKDFGIVHPAPPPTCRL